MSQAAVGKVETYRRLGLKAPLDWGLDSAGQPTNDPAAILSSRKFLPMGGHKGAGLALMLEMLTAVLAGGVLCGEMAQADRSGVDALASKIFIAMHPDAFGERARFDLRAEELLDYVRVHAGGGANAIYFPGQNGWRARVQNLREGIPIDPKTIADPPGGMRPVAIASDDRHVFYSCANDYGRLGCVVTCYDTRTGRAHYAVNPLDDQQIVSLSLDATRDRLVCGTTFHADSMSQPPTSATAMVAILDAATLRVVRSGDAPQGVTMVRVVGRLDAHHWLCSLHDHISRGPANWMTLDDLRLDHFVAGPRNPLPTNMTGAFHATKTPGRFVLNIDDRIELWDMCRVKRIKVLFEPFNPAKVDGYLFTVLPDDRIVALRSTEVVVAG